MAPEQARRYGLGKKPFKKDERDYLLRDTMKFRAAVATATPAKFWGMVSPEMRLDQGNEGTCVGHGCTHVLMDAPSTHPQFPSFADVDTAHQFARKLYFDATGDSTYQEGAYTRDALNVLKQRGQISTYYRLTSVEEIKTTLRNIGPVTFGSTWYNSMFNTVSMYNNQYLRVNPDSGVAGGHLYCLTGINDDPVEGPPYVRMENSWGRPWAKNGTARITLDDLAILFDGDCYLLTETPFE